MAGKRGQNGIQRLLGDLIPRYGGTKQSLADGMGITASSLSHLLTDTEPTIGTETCLRLAAVTGESASRILRAAGKEDIADLLEGLYGPAAVVSRRAFGGSEVTPYEHAHLAALRTLHPRRRRAVLHIVESMADAERAAPSDRLTGGDRNGRVRRLAGT